MRAAEDDYKSDMFLFQAAVCYKGITRGWPRCRGLFSHPQFCSLSENCVQVLLSNLEYIGEVLGVVAAKTE